MEYLLVIFLELNNDTRLKGSTKKLHLILEAFFFLLKQLVVIPMKRIKLVFIVLLKLRSTSQPLKDPLVTDC